MHQVSTCAISGCGLEGFLEDLGIPDVLGGMQASAVNRDHPNPPEDAWSLRSSTEATFFCLHLQGTIRIFSVFSFTLAEYYLLAGFSFTDSQE